MIQCPKPKGKTSCRGEIALFGQEEVAGDEIVYGTLQCKNCQAVYPILQGVAIVVGDVESYVLYHAKGISKWVPLEKIPSEYRDEFQEALAEIASEHIEEDLESERVNALYLMTHYLSADPAKAKWWQNQHGSSSPLIDALILEHWNHGPFYEIGKIFESKFSNPVSVLELGCGVGGLLRVVGERAKSYLGVDSSFASIALARHLNLGVPYDGKIRIPEDLLLGSTSRESGIAAETRFAHNADFIVGEIENCCLKPKQFDVSIVLNAMDMLEEPECLPQLQNEMVHASGFAIQSCPYIWHEMVSKKLRSKLVSARNHQIRDSAGVAKWLYEKNGFKILTSNEQVPWLFLKHPRQLEIYSAHLFLAQKA